MAKWYIYVDDMREIDWHTYDRYIWSCYVHGLSTPITLKDYASTIKFLQDAHAAGDEIVIDLDHDLGEEKSGYDIAKFIVETSYPILGFHIHSMNPVGVFNMKHLLTHYGYSQF